MKRENFVTTKNLQNAIRKQIRKNTNRENVNWLKIYYVGSGFAKAHRILFYIKHRWRT